ncbi:hypothetical protein Glove_360g153 [Diversispora epigaea]|uniref:HTH myb-type domain-containing protein n=1 Tax=Diversispora epigaea TaxID=1348612 RepID=A0A397HFB8_9GLOM|nr:hypothetical protein Glove_360g153 [Diversispora epigaea]
MKIRNDEKQMEQSKYNKGHFSKEEDTLILKYVNEHGKNNWKKVSAFVRTRSPKQCRERYYGSLEKSVNKDPFTDSQKMFISEFIYKHGNKWAELSRKLDTGHTPNMIKNKWHQQISRQNVQNRNRNRMSISYICNI